MLYLYLAGVDPQDVYPYLVAFLSVVSTAELLRFNFEWFNNLYCIILGPLMRKSEIKMRINGVVYYLAGCIIVLYWFPRDISSLSIIYLSWTDPMASICGRLWGKYTPKYGGKSLAGSLGSFLTGAIVTYFYFMGPYPLSYNPESSPVPLALMALYGGLVASVSEAVSDLLFGLDDNLTIPVLSAIFLWLPLVHFQLGW